MSLSLFRFPYVHFQNMQLGTSVTTLFHIGSTRNNTRFFSVSWAESFRCYSGMDNDLREIVCEECHSGVGCLCAKVPDFMGHVYRFCRVNPHNALAPGCFQNDYYQGLNVDHCFCATEMCNSSHSVQNSVISILITFVFRLVI